VIVYSDAVVVEREVAVGRPVGRVDDRVLDDPIRQRRCSLPLVSEAQRFPARFSCPSSIIVRAEQNEYQDTRPVVQDAYDLPGLPLPE
jgi:hypothetical protein